MCQALKAFPAYLIGYSKAYDTLNLHQRTTSTSLPHLISLTTCFFFFFCLQGVVAFSSQGDRIALTQIEQMIDGQYHKLGYYDTQADNLTWLNNEQWVGGKVNKLWKREKLLRKQDSKSEKKVLLRRLREE
jgi:hypothetical protein